MSTRWPRSSIRRRPTTTNITASTGQIDGRPLHRYVRARLALMRIDGMMIDDVSGCGRRGCNCRRLLALIPPAGAAPPTPAQARAMMEKMAKIYEGIRIGNAEMRGMSVETPEGPLKLAAIRFNLENGKVGEFAIEGVDGRTPQGPRQGRTLRAQIARCRRPACGCRRCSRTRRNRRRPTRRSAMIPLIEGVEVKGVAAPYKEHGQAAQHRCLRPGLGPVRRTDPEQITAGTENVGPARRARSRTESAGRGRPRQGGDRPRFRRGLDGSVPRIRAGARDARNRRPPEGLGAGFARQRAARRYSRPTRRRRWPRRRKSKPATLELTLRDIGCRRCRDRASMPAR